jgi:hypothetical protein
MPATLSKASNEFSAYHTDATELQVVENIQCYYLIPGTIVQGDQGGSSLGYVGDSLRKHHQVSMDLRSIPQQASGSGHLWGY